MYLIVHRSMRASARQLAESLAAGDTTLADDRRRTKALVRWYGGFADEIRLHHHIEDALLFPALAERVATYGDYEPTLTADHAELDVVLDRLGEALGARDLGAARRGVTRSTCAITSTSTSATRTTRSCRSSSAISRRRSSPRRTTRP